MEVLKFLDILRATSDHWNDKISRFEQVGEIFLTPFPRRSIHHIFDNAQAPAHTIMKLQGDPFRCLSKNPRLEDAMFNQLTIKF